MVLPSSSANTQRSGIVLIAVLLVVVILSLAAYQFSELMSAESRSSDRILKTTQARSLAESGIHYAAALLATPDGIANLLNNNPYDNPDMFQGKTLSTADIPSRQARFSILSVDYTSEGTGGFYPKRYGVEDECSKLNLNALMQVDPSGQVAYNALMKIPNMSEDVANSIIDWIDTNDEARSGGAESQYYAARTPSYRCKNGPLDSLEELLLVKGVTPQLLFGSDLNRNGERDSGEDAQSLDAGWLPYLTVYSREKNVDSGGTQRIHLNRRNNLSTLYNDLQVAIGQEMAAFVMAYRLFDLVSGDPPANSREGNASELASAVQRQTSGFSVRSRRNISSIFSLIEARVSVPAQQPNQPATIYTSPLKDAAKLKEFLPMLLDKTSTQSNLDLTGRVNINTATQQVLLSLPSITEQDVQTILSKRPALNSFDADPIFQTPAWLITEGQIPATTVQAMERYITTRSQVYRVQSVGYFDEGGPMVRLEAVIDTNQGKPRILYLRDLTELGQSFRKELRN